MSLRRTHVRALIFIIILLALAWAFGLTWELPESWKDSGIMTSSRARIAQVLNAKKANIDEIYGLLHLVTADSVEHKDIWTNNLELDPTKPISLDIYAAGSKGVNWSEEVRRLHAKYPIIVFSKTYCPFSRKAKALLAAYDLQPPPKVVEVDLRGDSDAVKAVLTRLTHHSTFPNILVRGKSLGGSDDLQALHATKALADIFKKAGVVVRGRDIQ